MRLTNREKDTIISILSDTFVRLGDEGLENTPEAKHLERIIDKLE